MAIILAADSARRLPLRTVVVRRLLFRSWEFATPIALGRGYALVGPLPIELPLVLPPDPVGNSSLPLKRSAAQFEKRSRRVRLNLALIRIVGVATAMALVLGLPYLTWKAGTDGFLTMIGIIGVLSLYQAVLAMLALVTIGRRKGTSLQQSVRLLWPFNAVRAGEIVQSELASGIPRAVVLKALVPDEEFVRRFRSYIYDAVMNSATEPEGDVLVSVYGIDRLRRMIDTVPTGLESGWFCPRCGAEFAIDVVRCSDCSTGVIVSGENRHS